MTPVALTSARAQSLLAYLALRPGTPQRRDRVAFLLWPDSTDQQARTNLRHVLHTLRASIPGSGRFLHATAQTLSLHDVLVGCHGLRRGARAPGDLRGRGRPLRR